MKNIKKVLLFAFIFRLLLIFLKWHPDLNNHIDWGIRFWQYGPRLFFAPQSNVWNFTWPNQPPITILTFALIRKLFEAIFSFFWFLNIKIPFFPSNLIHFLESYLYAGLLKLPSILSDLGIGYLIYKIFKDEKKEKVGIVASLVYLFNPVVWYNSAIWGQTDAFINFFALLAFYLLLKRKLIPAVFSLVISLYIKVSLAIFIPIFIVVALKQKYEFKKYLYSFLISLSFIGIISFIFSGSEPFSWLINLYKDRILGQQLQVITANAFNIWASIAGINERPQTLLLGPISFQTWGLVLFLLSYLPIIYMVFKKRDLKTIIFSLAICSISSFMLLTNMHERYLFPFFVYSTIVVFWNKKLLPIYIAVSLINFLNLYNIWWFPRSETIINFLTFSDKIMPRVLGFINFLLYIILYKSYLRLFKLEKL
ncbi:hypothetical protein KJ570_01955 [Patescibacteria group bacterium]|nr:hypothetical protein [Patescibacteria group bacterium]